MGTTNWVDALSADELPIDDVTGLAVAGVAALLYDSFLGVPAAKAP